MIAAELYQKTLAGYEASLCKGESVSLSRYCKLHQINHRGLRYWMKKNLINHPKSKLGSEARPSDSNPTGQLVPEPRHMIPLLIQSPMREKTTRLRTSSLKEVNISTQNGLVVCISEISCVDLAELILTFNSR